MEGRRGDPHRTGSRPSTAPTARLLPRQISSLSPTGTFCRLVLTEGTALDHKSRERELCFGNALGTVTRRKAPFIPGVI